MISRDGNPALHECTCFSHCYSTPESIIVHICFMFRTFPNICLCILYVSYNLYTVCIRTHKDQTAGTWTCSLLRFKKQTSSAPSFFVLFQAVLFHEGNLLGTLGMFRINTKQTLKNAPIVYNSSSLFWRQIDTPRLYYRCHDFLFSRPMIWFDILWCCKNSWRLAKDWESMPNLTPALRGPRWQGKW